MTSSEASRRKQAHSAGVLHAGLLTALVLVIATVALVSRPASPPTIAEFAPQAIENIKDAPSSQSSRFGEGGEGDCVDALAADCKSPEEKAKEAASTTTTFAKDNVVEVPRVKQCIGEPPRQIEDPQSPPCVPYWKGDNGGATWQGVTATEVKVVWPTKLGYANIERFTNFFNSRFQFYGRRLVVEEMGASGGFFGGGDTASQISDAVKVDEELRAFAALSYPVGYGETRDFYNELARRQVVTVDSTTNTRTERETYDHKDYEGYQWGYAASLDKLERNLATWICKSLVDKPPAHAGPAFQGSPGSPPANRKFGLAVQSKNSYKADTASLLEGLSRCGIDPLVQVRNMDDTSTNPSANMVSKFQSEDVSTLICICNNPTYGELMRAADPAGYKPEFLLFGGLGQTDDANVGHQHYPASALPHVFGIEGFNKILPVTDSPWFWALKEADPSVQASSFGGYSLGYTLEHHEAYAQMLLLASGIQMAGPNLTPESFKKGLMEAEFPNPGAGAAPYYQARVGFGPGNHTMIQDVALVWYDRQRKSDTLGVPGTLCYVDKGRRWSLTSWVTVEANRFHPQATPPTEPCK